MADPDKNINPECVPSTSVDTSSGLLTKSDNVEEAVQEELVNLNFENEELSSTDEIRVAKRSSSLTNSVHEMVDDLTKLKVNLFVKTKIITIEVKSSSNYITKS